MKKKTKATGELVYGIHPVIEILKAKKRKVLRIYTTKPEPKSFAQIKQVLPVYPIAIQYVSRDVLTKMVHTTDHQSIVAWVQSLGVRKKFFSPDKQQFLLMLDGVQDVRNLGAILRSAYCCGVDGVVLCSKKGARVNAAALKASAGLAEHVPLFVASSAQSAVQELKRAGYRLFLTTFDGQNATQVSYDGPVCIVIGNEAVGVTKSILSAGTKITLPQRHEGISYNASVAAGIMLFIAAINRKTL